MTWDEKMNNEIIIFSHLGHLKKVIQSFSYKWEPNMGLIKDIYLEHGVILKEDNKKCIIIWQHAIVKLYIGGSMIINSIYYNRAIRNSEQDDIESIKLGNNE